MCGRMRRREGGDSCGGSDKGGGGGRRSRDRLGGGVGEEELASERQLRQMGRRIRPIMKRSLVKIYAAALNVNVAVVLEDAIEESKA